MALFTFLYNLILKILEILTRILYALFAAAEAFVEDWNMPYRDRIGLYMENYTRRVVFPSARYSCLHRSPTNSQNRFDYIESSLLPDFKFRDKITGYEFYVEVKYRSYNGGDLTWSTTDQIRRYLTSDAPVFILFGLNWSWFSPDDLVLINLKQYPYPTLYHSLLDAHAISKDSYQFEKITPYYKR